MTPPSDRDPTTELIHHSYRPPAGFESATVPVHRASTIYFPDVRTFRARSWKDKAGYTYGTQGTPTTYTLEERIATLEGGLQALLVPSGQAAIALVDLALLRAGDEVLIPDNAYGPNKEFAAGALAHWGITHRVYDPMDADAFAAMIGPATRLVWVEAAGSVTLEFPDLPALVRAAKDRGVLVALDNTWGAGIAFDAFDLRPGTSERLGVDLTVHALTKYPSGGGDVLLGSVVTRDEALHLRIKLAHGRLGYSVGSGDVDLVLRSLPTIAMRYAAQDASARALAAWWATRPEAAQVLHPGLAGSPGHDHWRAVCGAGGAGAGIVSVVFAARYAAEQVHRFVDALTLFRIGASWAGPVSLAVPYDLGTMRVARGAVAEGMLVRFAVGFEAADALIADLTQALAVLEDQPPARDA